MIEKRSETVTDMDADKLSVTELTLLKNQRHNFKLTKDSLFNAFHKNDKEKLKFIANNFNYNLNGGLCNLFIDSSLEDGNEDMVKFLVKEFQCQPSLYAKQMAHINGHHSLAFWADTFTTQRNDVNIHAVHHNYKTGWANSIPEELRY